MAVRVNFQKEKFRKELMKHKIAYEKAQTLNLIEYAKEQVQIIGDDIDSYFGYSFENTGNLIESICWGVWYNGLKVKDGYYREGVESDEDSYLHALSPEPPKQKVNGRVLAHDFLESFQPPEKQGWSVVWAVLAPYYAYWEEGHINVLKGGEFVQFVAVSQRYDHIKDQLAPQCKVTFDVRVPTY